MSTSDTPQEHADEQVPRRPQELDAYVDAFLSLLCDTSRRYILELLSLSHGDDHETLPERRSGDIARAIGLSAATTSEHLRQLAQAGLVTSRRDGNVVYYRLRNHQLVQAFQDLLGALVDDFALRSQEK